MKTIQLSVIGSAVDSMAKSVKNLLHGIRGSVRSAIQSLSLATSLSAAALGAMGCGDSTDEAGHECFREALACVREKVFINFDGQTISCGEMREKEIYSHLYDVKYYCEGRADDGNADIEPYVATESEKELIVMAIRTRFNPVGVEVFDDAALLGHEEANVLTIGGFGKLGTQGVADLDPGNKRHDNIGAVAQYFLAPEGYPSKASFSYREDPQNIALVAAHEIGHMLGLAHPPFRDLYSDESIMTQGRLNCSQGLTTAEAKELAKNLACACGNLGKPFSELQTAAELKSEEAIQACSDLDEER